MLPWLLESVQDGPRNLLLNFGQHQAINHWEIANIEFLMGGGGGGVGGSGGVVGGVGGGGGSRRLKSFSCKPQT